jgi:hypothetical protein
MKHFILISVYLQICCFLFAGQAHAYLDPGTGSYIFQVLVATIIGALFTVKIFWQKIKNFFSNHLPKKQ